MFSRTAGAQSRSKERSTKSDGTDIRKSDRYKIDTEEQLENDSEETESASQVAQLKMKKVDELSIDETQLTAEQLEKKKKKTKKSLTGSSRSDLEDSSQILSSKRHKKVSSEDVSKSVKSASREKLRHSMSRTSSTIESTIKGQVSTAGKEKLKSRRAEQLKVIKSVYIKRRIVKIN